MLNKNISIWRGTQTPPTNYHLWEKEDGGLYIYLDEKWQPLVTLTDKITLDKHQKLLDKIKNLTLTEINPTDNNTYKSYLLKSDDNIFGETINIPKDRFIKLVALGYGNATMDSSTGLIDIGTGLLKEYLLFSVVLESGNYELVSINLTSFLTERDYADGLEVIDNKIKVKIDPDSEEYLKVSNNGIKIEGINTNFNKINERLTTISNTQIKRSEMGVANGVATLDNNGTIPYNLLPTIADDEDLIEVNNRLKLKDKVYDPDNFSGKGYVILRKNIVEGKNILTQDMINESNTIYEIRYDFDLNRAEIQIKDGCVLNFVGGSLSNGAIYFNDTEVNNYNNICIFTNIIIKGNGSLKDSTIVYDIWFNDLFKSKILSHCYTIKLHKDWETSSETDFVQGSNLNRSLSIIGNYKTFTFITDGWNRVDGVFPIGKSTFIRSKSVSISDLNIIVKNSQFKQGIATVFDTEQLTLNNVYAYLYDRLAANWSYNNYSENFSSCLKINNCRLYTTSFIFEGSYNNVIINNSHIELLYNIRSDFWFDVISICAIDKTHKAYAVITNSTIIGSWELPNIKNYNPEENYQYILFKNCRLIGCKVGNQVRNTIIINNIMNVIYDTCIIDMYNASTILNNINSVKYINCKINLYHITKYSNSSYLTVVSPTNIYITDCVIDMSLDTNIIYPMISFNDTFKLSDNFEIVFNRVKVIISKFYTLIIDYSNNIDSIIKKCIFKSSDIIISNYLPYNDYSKTVNYLQIKDSKNRYMLPFNNSHINSIHLNLVNLFANENYYFYYKAVSSSIIWELVKYDSYNNSIIGNNNTNLNKTLIL